VTALATALVAELALGGAGSACAPREPDARTTAMELTGGDPDRGALGARRHGCGACHTIAGVPGADALVGPPLTGVRQRAYIAGALPNTPANLIRWIRHPKAVDSLTAMPDVGLTDAEARDIAAFLYTVR
jgi:cytochrome c